ncbi:MAG: hypothetical protein WCK81_05960 [Betaproteobacteria bacterium]
MSTFLFFAVLGFGLQMRNALEQRKRIQFLAHFLNNYRIESLMQTLTDGYLRAMGEGDADRRQAVWNMLAQTEQVLIEQVQGLVADMKPANPADCRASTLPVGLPMAVHWLPGAAFDVRKVLKVHAQGIGDVIANVPGLSQRDRAFRLCAELLLMQHSCHWFCKSKMVASARMVARHQTRYAQLLTAVSPQTRQAYGRLMGTGPAGN